MWVPFACRLPKAKDKKDKVTFTGLAKYVADEVPDWVSINIGRDVKQSPNLKADVSNDPVLMIIKETEHSIETPVQLANKFTNSLAMKLVLLPSRKFMMGS